MANEHERFRALLERFDTAMLATNAPTSERGQRFHVRPMAIADVEPNCVTWFFTSRASPKAHELQDDDRVQVICQDDDTFVTIAGTAKLIEDRAKFDELWEEKLLAWFPRGKDDPDLVLIAVSPIEGEYWDRKGAKGVRYAFEMAKAAVKNLVGGEQRPRTTAEQHGKADLR